MEFFGDDDGTRNSALASWRADTFDPSSMAVLRPLTVGHQLLPAVALKARRAFL
jgi:hypothetical protein